MSLRNHIFYTLNATITFCHFFKLEGGTLEKGNLNEKTSKEKKKFKGGEPRKKVKRRHGTNIRGGKMTTKPWGMVRRICQCKSMELS